ncbi:DNA-binding transcriptional activator PspC [Paraliobacillus sp. PM-2]|uniref:PspC domain-containing protein n=1 Tax=Paraliobacillus sp. PM-2 TaxID=1462524 RepID=UPI00061C1188|nr:PspC domain-containing protein [Paraliobacillus sp. PM-2]CQR46810.1 DNA-binding transcriptional activator PspC [Paraliobacillus sp. PM-2]
MQKKLRKSATNKSISGVCGGIAEYFDISPLGVRILFIILPPVNVLVYLVLANTIPDSPPSL